MWIMNMVKGAAVTVASMVTGAATIVLLATLGMLPVSLTAPVAVQVLQGNREHVPTDQAPFYGADVAPEDVADVFTEVDAPLSVEIAALRSLVNGGAMGAVNDTGEFVYERVGTVREWSDGAETGIVAMTYYGPAICVDNEARRCAGGMYLTDYYLWGIETNNV